MTTISEGNKSDLLDDKGSSNFNAAMAMVQDKYLDLHDGIVLAHTMNALNLRKVVLILIDSQTTHNMFSATISMLRTFVRPRVHYI